jgi:hypothetical protein
MNKKLRLAADYAGLTGHRSTGCTGCEKMVHLIHDEMAQAFVVGFDKATNLAVKSFLANYTKCMGMTYPEAVAKITQDLRNLGEEEDEEAKA